MKPSQTLASRSICVVIDSIIEVCVFDPSSMYYEHEALRDLLAQVQLFSSRRGAEGAEGFVYQYDDIGNRVSSLDLGMNRTYVANALNQYTSISNLCGLCALAYNL